MKRRQVSCIYYHIKIFVFINSVGRKVKASNVWYDKKLFTRARHIEWTAAIVASQAVHSRPNDVWRISGGSRRRRVLLSSRNWTILIHAVRVSFQVVVIDVGLFGWDVGSLPWLSYLFHSTKARDGYFRSRHIQYRHIAASCVGCARWRAEAVEYVHR